MTTTEKYAPLPSVWEREDSDLLEKMLGFYPRSEPELILDATANSRRFWKDSTRPVIGLDIDPRYRPEALGTSLYMPFNSDVFDVVVVGNDDAVVVLSLLLREAPMNLVNDNQRISPREEELLGVGGFVPLLHLTK